MKNSKLLFVLAFGSLLMSCGKTPASSTTSNAPTSSNTPEPTTSVAPSTSSSSTGTTITIEDLEKVAASAKEKTDSIASGTITLDEANSYSDPTQKIIPFEFGKDKNGDVLHFVDYDWQNNAFDMYLMEDDSHNIVAVKKDAEGNISKPYDQYDEVQMAYQNLFGYGVSTLYGTEGLVEGLVGFVKKNVNKDAEYKFENNLYEMSFGYFESLDTYQYYVVSSSFSLGKNGEISLLNMDILCYNQSSFMVDDELQVIQLLDGATPSSSKKYKIEQVVGERTFENPISLDDFYATSFNLVFEEQMINDNDTISLEVESSGSIQIENVEPSTANFDFDALEISIIEGNANAMNANYNSYSNAISIYCSEAGTFKIQVQSKNVTKTFNVEITEAQPNSISLSYSVEGPEGYTAYTYNDGIDAYVGIEYILNAMVEPSAANQEIIASVEGASTEDYKLEKKSIQINSWSDARDMWCFTANKVGSYDVTLKCAVNNSIQKVVHIVATEAPTLSEVLKDDFALKLGYTIRYYVSFETSGDGMSGSMTIENRTNGKSEVASYTMKKGEKFYTLNLTHTSGEEFDLEFKLSFDFTLFLYEEGYGNQMSKVTPIFLLSGSWEGTSGDYSLNINFFDSKEVNMMINKSDYSDSNNLYTSFTLEETDNGYQGTILPSSDLNDPFVELPLTFKVDKDFTSVSISFTYGGTDYSFTLARMMD